MQIFHTIASLRSYLHPERQQGKAIGFVPTMGALHEGHLSLIEASNAQNDLTVCSIFVNPIQFNNPDDLARYPRTLEADCELLQTVGCDAVFAPSVQEIYPEKSLLTFDFGDLERVMEGKFHPGHFNGTSLRQKKVENRKWFFEKLLPSNK